MGMLDDMIGSAVPQGSVAKPLMLALMALLASGALHRSAAPAAPASAGPAKTPSPSPDATEDGGILGGLGGLLNRFQQNGMGDVINSWIGPGENKPVSPGQIGSTLGPDVLKTLSQRTGMSEQDLMNALSHVLPSAVDKLTPNGRLPTPQEAARFS
jgi:uncharacterized protein YidB (DUF937 family)